MGATYSSFFPPKPHWTAANIPDLSGKVFLVTGGNDGIGYETTKELLLHNGKVYIACRSKSKADDAIVRLKAETGREPVFLQIDLADLQSVKHAAETFKTLETKLNVLVANAGVWVAPIDDLTVQGLDLQHGVNVLGHWFLTIQLVPLLRAAAAEGTGAARIVTVSSYGGEVPTKIEWNAFADGPARRKLGSMNLYTQSKLFNVIQTQEYARRFGADGIITSALNPGNIDSSLYRRLPFIQKKLLGLLLYPVKFGAISSLYAATSLEAGAVQGAYYVPWAREQKPNKLALDVEIGARFWKLCEEQTKDI